MLCCAGVSRQSTYLACRRFPRGPVGTPSDPRTGSDEDGPVTTDNALTAALAEIESHVHAAGWDQRPALFAFVTAGRFSADDPDTAARLGLDRLPADALTPVEQEALPDQPLDEALGGIAWPESVVGCAVSQEIVVLPPSAEADLEEQAGSADAASAGTAADAAARHPERREARLTVGVLRDGTSAALLRLRTTDEGGEDDVLTGPDLAPNLVTALLATLHH